MIVEERWIVIIINILNSYMLTQKLRISPDVVRAIYTVLNLVIPTYCDTQQVDQFGQMYVPARAHAHAHTHCPTLHALYIVWWSDQHALHPTLTAYVVRESSSVNFQRI